MVRWGERQPELLGPFPNAGEKAWAWARALGWALELWAAAIPRRLAGEFWGFSRTEE